MNSSPLTGQELLAKVAKHKSLTKQELAIACGYVASDGKRSRFEAFLIALAEATKALPARIKRKPGHRLGYKVKVCSNNHFVALGAGYGDLIGAKPGDTIEIKHVGKTLVLRLAKD